MCERRRPIPMETLKLRHLLKLNPIRDCEKNLAKLFTCIKQILFLEMCHNGAPITRNISDTLKVTVK